MIGIPMDLISLSGFFVTVLLYKSIPGPVMLLVLARSANGGGTAALATVCGTLLAQMVILGPAIVSVAQSLAIPSQTRPVLQAVGLGVLIWLALRLWSGPYTHKNMPDFGKPVSFKGDVLQGMLAGASSPINLFLLLAVLPQLITPASLDPLQMTLLGIAFLVATAMPLMVAIWAGAAVRQFLTQEGLLINRTGAVVMLGFAVHSLRALI